MMIRAEKEAQDIIYKAFGEGSRGHLRFLKRLIPKSVDQQTMWFAATVGFSFANINLIAGSVLKESYDPVLWTVTAVGFSFSGFAGVQYLKQFSTDLFRNKNLGES